MMAMVKPGRILVGTSGWIYAHWRGVFYPPTLTDARWLEFVASSFPTMEVNATFYSLTTPNACDRWRAAVPSNFVFSVKGSRYITHMKQLRDVKGALSNFFASGLLRLGAQLGPILWQLPPRLKFREGLARDFFANLPQDVRAAEATACGYDERLVGRPCRVAPDGQERRIRYALEARHSSWMEPQALDILRANDIALVWADSGGEHPSTTVQTTDDFAYVRLHGAKRIYEGRYTKDELESWAGRAHDWARAGTSVFIYFDNDRDGAAPLDARRLLALIHGASEPTEADSVEGWQADQSVRSRPRHFAFPRRPSS